jgi:hypothetical protein
MEKLREMEVARQEMKRQAFEAYFKNTEIYNRECHVRKADILESWSEHLSYYSNIIAHESFLMWQAAQEQMLQTSTWNDYSLISPAIEGRYQIFINGEQVAADWIDKFGFADPFEGDALRQDLITHWQPLPQSPNQ